MKKLFFLFCLLFFTLQIDFTYAVDCPRATNAGTLVCDQNTDEGTLYGRHGNHDVTLDGTVNPLKFIHLQTYDDKGRSIAPTRNGIRLNGFKTSTSDFAEIFIKTLGNVLIQPDGKLNSDPVLGDTDGILADDGNIRTIDANIGTGTKIKMYTPFKKYWFYSEGSDGIVLRADEEVNLNSDADIYIDTDYGNGISVKGTENALLTIGGKITTMGYRGPGINVHNAGWGQLIGDANITLKDDLSLTTNGDLSPAMVYNPHGETNARPENVNVIAGTSHITTKGEESHGIATAGGGVAGTENDIVLNGTQIETNGDTAHGVFVSTIINDIGAETATVTMNTDSVITVKGKDSTGIHFKDSSDAANRGTTGVVTLNGNATIDASAATDYIDDTSPGMAIFTARGSDDVILKDNVKIKGMVDGGDDYGYPDTWVDELIFDSYNSAEQLNYAGDLVEYRNFEDVKLTNGTVVSFPENYETPLSQTFQIDETSTLKENTSGTKTSYTINADLINNGTIDLRDDVIGDNLIINGNVSGSGVFLMDIDPYTGESDTITIVGDDREIDFEIDPKSFVQNADPSEVIDVVFATGKVKDTSEVTLEDGETTYTHDGVTYTLFEYDDPVKGHVWALGTHNLILEKTATLKTDLNNNGKIDVGDTLEYTITATNSGSLTLTGVVLSDDKLNISKTCDTLAKAETCVLTGDYVVTEDDLKNGKIVNIATANSDQTEEIDKKVETPVEQIPGSFSSTHNYFETEKSYDSGKCETPDCESVEGDSLTGTLDDIINSTEKTKTDFSIASITKQILDEKTGNIDSEETIYDYKNTGTSYPKTISELYIPGKKIVYTYNYVKKIGKVTIQYFEEGTDTEVASNESITGPVGKEYDTTAQIKDILGYEFVSVKQGDSETGNLTEDEKVITYYYKKKDIGQFEDLHNYFFNIQSYNAGSCNTENCTYEDGQTGTGTDSESIDTDDIEKDNFKLISVTKFVYNMNKTEATNDDILESEAEVYNYQNDDSFPETTVVYENGKRIVYEYSYIKRASVKVKYFEKITDKVLEKEEILTGFIGEEYNTQNLKKNIFRYDFDSLKDGDTEIGAFGEVEQVVYYYVRKNVISGGGGVDIYVPPVEEKPKEAEEPEKPKTIPEEPKEPEENVKEEFPEIEKEEEIVEKKPELIEEEIKKEEPELDKKGKTDIQNTPNKLLITGPGEL